jgi:LAO/AO transport system kinase
LNSNIDAALVDGVRRGDRRAISRAITLVESSKADHRDRAERLLGELLKIGVPSLRIGITGVPGVGKSTLIEALGNRVVDHGHRIAVLTVDPSSSLSGGSILGDKTRMETLSRRDGAYVRPSPSAGSLGGVGRRTRESMVILEAAGFDVIVVETVGVGQSETLVERMTDVFLLLLLPGGGDELQGIKRGIMELADVVVVNKADGEMKASAGRAVAEYRNALRLMQRRYREWQVPVSSCSAITGEGVEAVWSVIEDFAAMSRDHGHFSRRRDRQQIDWFRRELHDGLLDLIASDSRLAAEMQRMESDVLDRRITPAGAARRLVELFKQPRSDAR